MLPALLLGSKTEARIFCLPPFSIALRWRSGRRVCGHIITRVESNSTTTIPRVSFLKTASRPEGVCGPRTTTNIPVSAKPIIVVIGHGIWPACLVVISPTAIGGAVTTRHVLHDLAVWHAAVLVAWLLLERVVLVARCRLPVVLWMPRGRLRELLALQRHMRWEPIRMWRMSRIRRVVRWKGLLAMSAHASLLLLTPLRLLAMSPLVVMLTLRMLSVLRLNRLPSLFGLLMRLPPPVLLPAVALRIGRRRRQRRRLKWLLPLPPRARKRAHNTTRIRGGTGGGRSCCRSCCGPCGYG